MICQAFVFLYFNGENACIQSRRMLLLSMVCQPCALLCFGLDRPWSVKPLSSSFSTVFSVAHAVYCPDFSHRLTAEESEHMAGYAQACRREQGVSKGGAQRGR